MIDFVGTTPFLRMALRVAMVTMHFHKAQLGFFLGTSFFCIQGVLGNNLAPMKDFPGVQGRSK